MPHSRANRQPQPPSQTRSRRTLDRILAATETLLRSRRFERIAVADIVRQARTSTGSFYARFASREAVLPALYERYDANVVQRVRKLTDQARWAASSLDAAAARIVRYFIRFFGERVNLLRALAIFVRQRPEAVGAAARGRRAEAHAAMLDGLFAHRREMRHAEATVACRLGLYFVVCACRDRVLFGESTHADSLRVSDAQFERETARMLAAYLRAGER